MNSLLPHLLFFFPPSFLSVSNFSPLISLFLLHSVFYPSPFPSHLISLSLDPFRPLFFTPVLCLLHLLSLCFFQYSSVDSLHFSLSSISLLLIPLFSSLHLHLPLFSVSLPHIVTLSLPPPFYFTSFHLLPFLLLLSHLFQYCLSLSSSHLIYIFASCPLSLLSLSLPLTPPLSRLSLPSLSLSLPLLLSRISPFPDFSFYSPLSYALFPSLHSSPFTSLPFRPLFPISHFS